MIFPQVKPIWSLNYWFFLRFNNFKSCIYSVPYPGRTQLCSYQANHFKNLSKSWLKFLDPGALWRIYRCSRLWGSWGWLLLADKLWKQLIIKNPNLKLKKIGLLWNTRENQLKFHFAANLHASLVIHFLVNAKNLSLSKIFVIKVFIDNNLFRISIWG